VKYCIVTTCMGRAEHLKVSLPMMLAQDYDDYGVMVMDWDSKDDLGQVLYANRGLRLHSLARGNQEHFHLSAARNSCAQHAIDHLGPEWLVFIDADILLPPDFLTRNDSLLTTQAGADCFLQSERLDDGDVQIWGSCIVRASDWKRVKGYDEDITGYGFEDNDFYERLMAIGIERCRMDLEGVTAIQHPEELRFANYPDDYVDGQDYGRDRC